MLKNIIKSTLGLLLAGGFCNELSAQDKVVDQIVAIVGSNPILKSDIETQAMQMQAQGMTTEGDMKCEILEEYLFQKLLLNQAMIDSIEVTPKEVDTELNRRLGIFINQMGSEEKLEEY